VIIRNQGNTAVSDHFWVDVYFDPNQPPRRPTIPISIGFVGLTHHHPRQRPTTDPKARDTGPFAHTYPGALSPSLMEPLRGQSPLSPIPPNPAWPRPPRSPALSTGRSPALSTGRSPALSTGRSPALSTGQSRDGGPLRPAPRAPRTGSPTGSATTGACPEVPAKSRVVCGTKPGPACLPRPTPFPQIAP